jgi:peptidyl-prolyl cis-trans isomerase D
MLNTLRKGANSLVAKILFGILVLSFAVWGIGDIFRGGGRQSYVAQIGDQKIGREMLMSEYNRYLEQLRPMFGGHLDAETAKKLGFPQAVLQQMAGRAVFDQASQDLGLAVSDRTIRAKIENDQAFKGIGGTFDELTFRRALMEAGLTEDSYVSGLRHDIVRQELIDSVRGNGKAPASMAAALYRVREEKRTADSVAVPDASLPDPAEPDEAALAAYHKDHAAAFTAPEYRGVAYLALTPADLAKDVEVSDEDLRQAYEDNKARFTTPERRTVSQIVTPTQADAGRAEKMLAEGKDFADVAKEVANQDKDAIELGTLAKEQLPKDLRDPVFALAEGGVTQPVKTALGWHILKATAIEPGSVKSFDEARDGLKQDIAQDRARDRVDAAANKWDTPSGASQRKP